MNRADTCPQCNDTGMRNMRAHVDAPCTCEAGVQKAQEARERYEKERAARHAEAIVRWNLPEEWPC